MLLFSPSVMSDSLQPHGLQHASVPCPCVSYVCVYLCAYMHVCILTYVYACMYMHIYININLQAYVYLCKNASRNDKHKFWW